MSSHHGPGDDRWAAASVIGVRLEPDLVPLDDEALVVLANECDYAPARDEILLRYSPQTERLIQWLARSTEFNGADVEDARQNAVFWTVEAIAKFDTDQADRVRNTATAWLGVTNGVMSSRSETSTVAW